MDETALAIARLREDAKPDKSSGPDRLASDDQKKAKGGLTRTITGSQKAGGGAPSASTKRAKTFGS